MHLNIPPKNETVCQYWLRNGRWVLLGIFAPELVVLAAWRQWNSARTMGIEFRKILDDEDSAKPQVEPDSQTEGKPEFQRHRKHAWTSAHSFYATMGGLAFEVDEPSQEEALSFLPTRSRLTLTARGVLLLARCGHLPDIDKGDIEDKSKADSIAKTLVCIQAGWMMLQIAGRIATKLPVTLLEVNTLGHILCAFVIYVLWWHKPREVYEPTIITGDWVNPLCVYMYMSSRVSGHNKTSNGVLAQTWLKPEFLGLAYYPEQHEIQTDIREENRATRNVSNQATIQIDQDFPQGNIANEAASESTAPQRIANTIFTNANSNTGSNTGRLAIRPQPLITSPTGKRTRQRTIRRLEQMTTLDPIEDTLSKQLRRKELAVEAIHSYPAISSRFVSNSQPTTMTNETGNSDSSTGVGWLEPITEQLLSKTISNWPADNLLPGLGGEVMGAALWFASMAYGGIHVAAWQEYFPTPAERIMWRLSSVYISCSGLLWFILNIFAHVSPWASEWWDRFYGMQAHWTQYVFLGLVAAACGLLYIFARVFLVLDSLISLRKLPVGAYTTLRFTALGSTVKHFTCYDPSTLFTSSRSPSLNPYPTITTFGALDFPTGDLIFVETQSTFRGYSSRLEEEEMLQFWCQSGDGEAEEYDVVFRTQAKGNSSPDLMVIPARQDEHAFCWT
ncbi:MAG: hypothetical protein M1827_007115 [Pycnora praestabilis]|nr:MAG: hypothetical protein M1827_007115 [Pycnora praestabilis]